MQLELTLVDADPHFRRYEDQFGDSYIQFSGRERGKWSSLKAAQRTRIMFRCAACGSLDYVIECGICFSRDIQQFIQAMTAHRVVIIDESAEAAG